MNKFIFTGFGFCLVVAAAAFVWLQQPSPISQHQYQANEQLNPSEEGNGRTITGKVLAISPDIGPNQKSLFQLDIGSSQPDIIWASTFVDLVPGQIHVGDLLVFKGYISVANHLDPSGHLESLIQSPTLLMARTIETP